MYSVTGCVVGILGTLVIVIFYQNSWIRSTVNYIYHECYHKEKRDKGTTPCPSQENKNVKIETLDKQSLTSHEEGLIIITIPPDTSVTKEEKS